MNEKEHDIQSAFVEWCKLHEGLYPELKNLFAIPNAGKRGAKARRMAKAEGLQKGVPDQFLAYPVKKYSGLFLEFKTQKGRVSKEQADWLDRLSAAGYLCALPRSLERAIEITLKYIRGEI